MKRLVIIGDTFLDRDLDGTTGRLSPDAPVPVVEGVRERVRPGGAALTAAIAARNGHAVTLVTAIGDDAAGRRIRRALTEAGVAVHAATVPTTGQKVRVRADGVPVVRVDLGDEPVTPSEPAGTRAALAAADAIVVSDYGRGMAGALLAAGRFAGTEVPLVWDPHPRGPRPPAGTTVTTPNASEAGIAGDAPLTDAIDAAQHLRAMWAVGAVAVTRGAAGAVLASAGDTMPFVAPAPVHATGDACGAGDAFAATLGARLASSTPLPDAVVGAVTAATHFVAGRHLATYGIGTAGPPAAAAGVPPTLPTAVVVATSGHFDRLHDGHVEMLRCARRLGDRLVVLVNSDRSRAALGRAGPPEHERVARLLRLPEVDDVVLFDEVDPLAVLRALRPAVFVKGGDYSLATAETYAVRAWGGRAVTVPWFPTAAVSSELSHAHPT